MANAAHIDSAPVSATRAAWDASYFVYRARLALLTAEEKFGALPSAEGAYDTLVASLENDHGARWREDPVAQALADSAFDAIQAAEDGYYTRYVTPLTEAQCELLRLPAPDFDAVQIKADVMASYGLGFRDLGASPCDIIAADVERLTGIVA